MDQQRLKKILDDHSPSADVVSEALKATAIKFHGTKSTSKEKEKLRSCCSILKENTKQPPDKDSVMFANSKGCPKAPKAKSPLQST
jgi:hypothetical protein